MSRVPRLRDGSGRDGSEPYPLGEIPDEVVLGVARYLTYQIAIGRLDVDGRDWGDAFAFSIGGEHLSRPLGIADVVWKKMAWSTKTVKITTKAGPHSCQKVRLISGRNSPDYSFNITDPHADIQATGSAVLKIWNDRVTIAQRDYSPVRNIVLLRSADCLQYTVFEEENHRFNPAEFTWSYNKAGNLEGKSIGSDDVKFTWQFSGAHFTIHAIVPRGARKFKLSQPSIADRDQLLESIGYSDEWVALIQ